MKFNELIHELECDYGRINFRERLMLRRAYDVIPEQEDEVVEANIGIIDSTPMKVQVEHLANTTSMKCLKCGTVMIQQQHFGGGIYWLCGKCGSKVERTGV